MFGKKKLSEQDSVTKQLQHSGVYTIGHGPRPFIVENDTVEAVKTKKIYGFWSGVWYTTILSILLFWLPPFGQMVAGYVGGRKAGTPRLGALAAFAPMSIIFLLFALRYTGRFVDEIDWFLGLPGSGADWISANLPVFGPVIGFMSDYMQTFVSTLWSGGFFIYPYALTVIFGYVGGIMSLQHRRELEADGKNHPFVPFAIMPHPMPVPAPTADNPFPAREAPPAQEPPKAEKGWKMKKDKKKEKW